VEGSTFWTTPIYKGSIPDHIWTYFPQVTIYYYYPKQFTVVGATGWTTGMTYQVYPDQGIVAITNYNVYCGYGRVSVQLVASGVSP
jgi:hypothetical protein